MSQLSAEISADVTGYKRAIDEARKSLNVFNAEESATAQTMRKVYDVTQDQVKIFKKSLDAMEKATDGSKSNKAAAIALAKELEKMKMQWANLSETARKSNFGKQMASAMREAETRMKSLQTEMSATNKGIAAAASTMGSMSTGLSVLSYALYSFGGPAAIATAAVKTLKDTLLSSESNIDSWGRMIQGAETTYLHFVNALRTMDLSSFSLSTAFGQGRSAYDAADTLDTFGGVNTAYVQQLYTRLASMRAKKADGEKIDREEIKALEKEFEAYFQSKGNKTQRAVWETLQSKTPGIDIYSEPYASKLQQMFSGKVRGDQIWDNLGDSMSAEDRREQRRAWQADLDKMRQERNKFVKENEVSNIYSMPSISNDEYVKKLNEYDANIASLEANLNESYANHSASALQEYEGAVREAIAEMTKMQADLTELENVKKALNKLNAKGDDGYLKSLEKERAEAKKMAAEMDKALSAVDKSRAVNLATYSAPGKINTTSIQNKIKWDKYNDQKLQNMRNSVKFESWTGNLSTLNSSLSSVFDTMKGIGDLDNPFKVFDALINTATNVKNVVDTMQSLGTMMRTIGAINKAETANAIAMDQAKIASNQAETASSVGAASAETMAAHASIPFAGIAIATAAIGAMIAVLASTKSKVPKFANGAVLSGPTFGLMGEYPGAANNPEVVAPLSKLKGMLKDESQLSGELILRARGRDLVAVLGKENRLNSRR